MVIQNLRILPVSGPAVERGTLVLVGPRLEAVGAGAPVPAGAEVVDGTGLTASPGFIDLGTGIGLVEIAQVPAANDGEESSDPITPQVRAADAYFLDSDLIPVVRAAGTIVILSTPGTSNVIAGQSALMRTAGETLEEAALAERAALNVNLGEGPKRVWNGRGRAPMTRMGIAMLLRQTLQQGREYAARRQADPRAPIDLKLEPIAEAIAGRLPVVVHAERRDDILLALDLAAEYGFRLILSGGSEAATVAPRLAREKVPVIIAIDQQPDGIETQGAGYDMAARLSQAGVTIAFQSNEVTLSRNLVPNVGLAVGYGLPPEEALKALTLTPARIFGIADRLGSLEAGKEATFILTRGDPLQARSKIVATFVRGRRYAPRSYQTRLCETYIAPKKGGIPCVSE
jgi:imidazolonepropionase-like amidohydrolase